MCDLWLTGTYEKEYKRQKMATDVGAKCSSKCVWTIVNSYKKGWIEIFKGTFKQKHHWHVMLEKTWFRPILKWLGKPIKTRLLMEVPHGNKTLSFLDHLNFQCYLLYSPLGCLFCLKPYVTWGAFQVERKLFILLKETRNEWMNGYYGTCLPGSTLAQVALCNIMCWNST